MGGSVIDRLLGLLMPLFSLWGYAIVFIGVLLESLFLTGWVAPGTTVVLLAGFYAAQGQLDIFLVAATAFLAALAGDLVGFRLGRRLGREVAERYGRHARLRRGMQRGQAYFARYGGVTVVFGRMVSGLDAFIPLTAGLNAMPIWKYLGYDLLGVTAWCALFSSLGFFLGTHWRTIDRVINAMGWSLLAALALACAFIWARRARGRRAQREARGGGNGAE